MSIYSTFEDRLDIAKINKTRTNTRESSLTLAKSTDNEAPLLGIQYSCDFRHEEESGAGKMSEIFTRTSNPEGFFAKEYLLKENNRGLLDLKQADLVVEKDDYVAFCATEHIYDLDREFAQAAGYIRMQEYSKSKDRLVDARKYELMTVVELKAEAKLRGMKGYSKLKGLELERLLISDDLAKLPVSDTPEEVITHNAWFHNGQALIFRKTDDLFGEVLQSLVEAAKVGALLVGGGSVGFGSGFTLFDARDVSESLKNKISEDNRWYREQMELLKPVADIVKEGPMKGRWGTAYYALGSPSLMDGVVKYWLNGSSVSMANGRSDQPYGWYSLQELLDEKYMIDAAKSSDEKILEFDDSGSYRSKKLTREQAEEVLKSKGLTFALTPEGKLATK